MRKTYSHCLALTMLLVSMHLFAQTAADDVKTADQLMAQHKYQDAANMYAWAASERNWYAKEKIGELLYDRKIESVNYRPVYEKLTKLAAAGDMQAKIDLAVLLVRGYEGVPVNLELSKRLFEELAAAGNDVAINDLALFYYETGEQGLLPRDYNQAVLFYQRAYDKGNLGALRNLVSIYKQKNLPTYNPDKSVALLEDGLKRHLKSCAGELITLYEEGVWQPVNGIDPEKFLQAAITDGDDSAEWDLAFYYLEDIKPEREHQKGMAILEKYDEKDSTIALLPLANCYLKGDVVEQNIKKGLYYLEKAFKEGRIEAGLKLYQIYFQGMYDQKPDSAKANRIIKAIIPQMSADELTALGVRMLSTDGDAPKNLALSKLFFEKAASLNNSRAMNNLANMYCDGNYVRKDLSKAIALYKAAISLHDAYAMFDLALIYHNGEGLDKPDINKALKLYEAASEKGSLEATWNLSEIYGSGEYGVKKNYRKQKFLYERACLWGHLKSMFNLGLILLYDETGFKDTERGLRLMKKTCLCGVPNACKELEFYAKGNH